MSETTVLVVALLQLLPAVAWTMVARGAWRFGWRRARSAVLPVLAGLATVLAAYFFLQTAFTLVPGTLHDAPPGWLIAAYILGDVLAYLTVALFRDFARLLRTAGNVGKRWLAVNYGLVAFMSVFAVIGPSIMPFATMDERLRAYAGAVTLYSLVQTALGVRDMAYAARPGPGFRSGAGVTVTHRVDVALLGTVVLLLVAMIALHLTGSWREHPIALRGVVTAMGLVLVVPVASRTLGEMLRGLVMTTTMVVAAAAVYLGVESWVLPHVPAAVHTRVRIVGVLVLVVLLGPGQRMLQRALDALLFGRGRRRVETLLTFLQALEPARGVQGCCEGAVNGLVRIGGARGAAIVLVDDAGAAAGSIALAPLRAAWSEVPVHPTERIVPWPQFAGLPPAAFEALIEQDVAVVLPIIGPRRVWGHLFLVRGVLAVADESDAEAATAITGQLALLFDAADLLGRAVAVERSLAHAEKLAAIGETAARIAHEIRNPVTAARSLAQQLAREPGTSHAAELGLILEELERVERQVASLLRFARREDLRLDTVDLSELVRSTVAGYHGRLEAAHVALACEVTGDVTARADRERLRQVLVNLLDNALDALSDGAEPRRLGVTLTARNGTATMEVSDNGPGVEDQALARLFEPFFSLKPTGTGLGLAIARRTVESHGGRIAACRAADGGLAVVVDLPLGTS